MSDNILLQKIGGASTLTGESFVGSDCSGSNGDTNRVLTTTSASDASGDIMVFVDGQFLRETTNFTISVNDITLLIKIWDSQLIDVKYV